MISSGALPNVALSRPPIASPVRVETCSVDRTINDAIGTIATAAEKKIIGAETPACSRISAIGMKTKSQSIEGFMARLRGSSGLGALPATALARSALEDTSDEGTHDAAAAARGPRSGRQPERTSGSDDGIRVARLDFVAGIVNSAAAKP
jgi:hypothetical protein